LNERTDAEYKFLKKVFSPFSCPFGLLCAG
jgi:hypothetical protein